ncbi:DNA-binding transcriptional LysR family regulator [Rhizobium sp. PP-F2F-G38]|nr:DNA-binding transcriptional LysR family regulator [Rhizobium sp. PP-WC-1G-195]PYE99520.1 DNA-binding transcriptional LysR family regulator [Rhizobium sp. PP-F2F-G38]
MDSLRGIESFVRSVEMGSIAAAARQLGISPAAASQNIARLERDLGVRLLQRTTRRLGLTDSGQVYFERVRHVVHALEAAATAVSALNDAPRGRLTISASVAFGRHVIAPLIPGFASLYPQLSVELVVTDRAVDHIAEGIDISVRFAEQLEPSLIARRLVTVPMMICASPDYLARRGHPKTPEDLVHHDCLLYRLATHGRLFRWTFLKDGTLYEPDIKPKIISNDIDTLTSMVLAGAGIARLGAFIADALIAKGSVVPLFSDTIAAHTPFTFYACTLDRHSATPKIRAFIDYAVAALSSR